MGEIINIDLSRGDEGERAFMEITLAIVASNSDETLLGFHK